MEDKTIANFHELEYLKGKGIEYCHTAAEVLRELLNSKNESVRLTAAQTLLKLATTDTRSLLG